ncbi:hypothetical protein [Nocardia terpenica]|uniref:Uncharacterized protein n=1 Tax=Nocardia terpenica TaxID=455432 RepID=A0A6G9ZDJ1_9NOCA|nr:hypothetical protein [Nocardia terpenica]QIS23514.1 hypothetical protein F6W96_39700 [Nocardia terpenica]
MAAQWQQRRSGPAFEEDGSTSEEDGPTLEEARAEIALDLTDAWQEASGESGPPPNLPRGYGNTPWRWYHYATLALGGAAAVGLYSGHRYFAGTSESSSEPTPPPAAETMNPGEPTASGSQIPASSPRPPLAVPSQTLPAHLIRAHAASTAHSQQNQADTIEGSANNGMVAYRTAGNPRMEARATPFSWRNFKDHNHTRHVPEMCRITGLVRHTIKIKCDKNPYFSEYLISVEAKAGDGRDFKGIVESDWNGNRLSCDSQEHSVGLHHFLSTRTIGVEPPIRAKDVLAGPVGWSKLKVIPILRDDPEATSTTEGLSTFQEDISGKESPLPAEPNPQHMPELILPRFKTEIKSAGHVSILPEGCEISAPYREYHAKTLSVRCDRTPLFDTMMITLKARHKDGRRITHQAQGRADGNYYSMSLQESVGELLHGSSWTSELIVTPIRQTEQDKDPSETHHPSPSTPEESDEMLAPDSFDKIPGALSETGGGVKFQKGMSVGGAALSYLNAWAAYKNDDEPIDQASAYIGALGETLNTGGQYIPKGKWLGILEPPSAPWPTLLSSRPPIRRMTKRRLPPVGSV